jgi:hypothetical protein
MRKNKKNKLKMQNNLYQFNLGEQFHAVKLTKAA